MLNTIEQLNREARILNSQREQMIGKKEMAEKAYRDSVNEYMAKYGVQITTANVDAEYVKVENEVKENIEKLKANILSIKNGDYKNKKESVDVVDTGVMLDDVKVKTDEMVVKQEIKEETVVNSNVEPVMPKVEETPVVKEEVKEEPVAKPSIDEGFDTNNLGWGNSSKSINDNFNDILGGTEFQL